MGIVGAKRRGRPWRTSGPELIADRVWRSRSQLELAIVEYIGWFNHPRLHEAVIRTITVAARFKHPLDVTLANLARRADVFARRGGRAVLPRRGGGAINR